MTGRREGFTIVEVLIAMVMMTIGILAMAQTTGGITRMMSNGQRKTRSFAVATSLMDSLRNQAKQSCAGMVGGTGSNPVGITKTWTVSSSGSTNTSHTIRVITAYRVGTRAQGDTLYATIYC
jgi:Tfp pilus assembly protein PilV